MIWPVFFFKLGSGALEIEIHLDVVGLDDIIKKRKKKGGNKASECLLMAKQNNKF